MWRFILIGVLFGVALTQGEVVSWYRITEMFQFDSFHMYGVIGSAVAVGAIFLQIAKARNWKATSGASLDIFKYEGNWFRYLMGGTIFGIGWAMTGACPGPMFILAGAGIWPILVAVIGGILGTLAYAAIRKHLPH
jgi:uncharacterized membrane protein YedE/YeeE